MDWIQVNVISDKGNAHLLAVIREVDTAIVF